MTNVAAPIKQKVMGYPSTFQKYDNYKLNVYILKTRHLKIKFSWNIYTRTSII